MHNGTSSGSGHSSDWQSFNDKFLGQVCAAPDGNLVSLQTHTHWASLDILRHELAFTPQE